MQRSNQRRGIGGGGMGANDMAKLTGQNIVAMADPDPDLGRIDMQHSQIMAGRDGRKPVKRMMRRS